MVIWKVIVCVVAYLVLAPIVGGFLAGIDRKISAHMQGRVGPPIRQPFYDVFKLFEKERITVNKVQDFYVGAFFFFILVTGCLFFAGCDMLLVLFTLTTAGIFLVVGAYCSNSPYAEAGAEREILQMMAYEPMILLVAIAFYIKCGSFKISDIVAGESMTILPMIGIFLGFMFILTIKLRKAPFDLSMSHHAHQELVAGLKTEFSGSTLAILEAAHWYENVFLLGFIFLFFCNGTVWGYVIGILVCLAAYFVEIFIGNTFARMKWPAALKSSWAVAAVLGLVNVFVLLFVAQFI